MTQAPAGGPAGRLPDFVVLGAQKSASTFLQDQLAQHPDIEIAQGETRAFEDPEYSEARVAALPKLFERETARRGIKRPDYLGHPEVPARLARHIPEARLFAVIREPVARAVSSYYHYVRHGFVPLVPVDEAFEALLSNAWAADYPRSVEIMDYGMYGRHLERYLQHFGREQLMVFEQKALTSDAAGSLRQAFEFLQVDPDFVPSTTAAVSNRGVYSHRRLALLRTKNRFMYRYTPNLDRRYPRRPSPVGWMWNASVVGVDRLILSRFDAGRPPQLSPEVSDRVAAHYEADRAALSRVLAGTQVRAGWLGQ